MNLTRLQRQADGWVRVDEHPLALKAREEELSIREAEHKLAAHLEFAGVTGRAVQVVWKVCRIP